MARKLGRLLIFATIAGAAAAAVSYMLQYKSFHDDLEEEFHEFEDDDFVDETDNRNYVALSEDKKALKDAAKDTWSAAKNMAGAAKNVIVGTAKSVSDSDKTKAAIDKVKNAAGKVADVAGDASIKIRDAAGNTIDKVKAYSDNRRNKSYNDSFDTDGSDDDADDFKGSGANIKQEDF